ncbi:MAG: M81 family metallopeptidase [Erysipelotrichaceae bacterium]|nr:M81 family metallopeptidase [Erysipelotrichaceae bacterium]
MNILVGSFTTESNTKVPYKTTMQNYDIRFNEDALKVMELENCEQRYNVHVIPSIYANANAVALVEFEAFDYIEKKLLNTIKDHINEIDGIYLHLHGASYVENIGSGDHHIIREIRKIVGPYLPIAVSCDPHGNLTKEYVESLQIIRSYRESPHTDASSTRLHVFEMLVDLLNNRENIVAQYEKLALILGGEQSVSADEPVLSINRFMDKMEEDPRIRSVSWHVGYLRHDCAEAGCGVVVIPQSGNDNEYCKQKCKELAKYVWDKRYEFHYTGLTGSVEDSIDMALNFSEKPFVITDSGDNTTSGATGWNTLLLKKLLASNSNKKMLFASIRDEECFNYLDKCQNNDCHIRLGVGRDENSPTLDLDVIKMKKAPIYLAHGEVTIGTLGEGILVRIKDTNVYVIVANKTGRITNATHLDVFDINWLDFDIVVVKQGYIFPEFKKGCKGYIMALTDGDTLQDTKHIGFKHIMRPMYPIDEI